jgi:hypothetical protein
VSRYRDWYPWEVPAKHTPGPWTDIYMVARCMDELAGSRQLTQFRAFARGCMLKHRHARPGDAWKLLSELDDLLDRLFGPPRFHPFRMPAKA